MIALFLCGKLRGWLQPPSGSAIVSCIGLCFKTIALFKRTSAPSHFYVIISSNRCKCIDRGSIHDPMLLRNRAGSARRNMKMVLYERDR